MEHYLFIDFIKMVNGLTPGVSVVCGVLSFGGIFVFGQETIFVFSR